MKKLNILIVVSIVVISMLVFSACQQVPTGAATEGSSASMEATSMPASNLGTAENPIILAFAPSMTNQQIIESGKPLVEALEKETGYVFDTSIPTSYAALIEAMGSGNAHVALFPTFSYLIAHDKGYANVGLIVERYGSTFYGSQFVAAKSSGFTPCFDPETNQNTADAATALAQFEGKKPCWTDPLSTSGYIIPAGYLAQLGIETQPAVMVQGHPAVITALNAGGICDFGATFIDVRTNPTLQETIPDVMEKIVVIWRTDAIIPNDNISFATNMDPAMVAKIKEAFLKLSSTEEGKAILKAIYGFESVKEADDTFYDEFRVYIKAAGFDYSTAIE